MKVFGAVLAENAPLSARADNYVVVNSCFNPNFMVAYADGRPLSGPVRDCDGSRSSRRRDLPRATIP